MSKLYFDCFSGISGDMTIAAMIEIGLPLDYIISQIGGLGLVDYRIEYQKVNRSGLVAGRFIVEEADGAKRVPTDWKSIRNLIESAGIISNRAKDTAIRIFSVLAEAEATVHGSTPESVHFHEVGALDSIIDIVATAVGFDWFGAPEIISSPLPLSRGTVETEHGTLPLPAPAVVELTRGVPAKSSPEKFETVTPTGAAIIKALASGFGEWPEGVLKQTGYGAGTKIGEHSPNLLRLALFDLDKKIEVDLMIEASIDDMNPELFENLFDLLYAAGAADVFLRRIQMKKNRPGEELVVLTNSALRPELTEIIFRESTSIGLRYHRIEREMLERKVVEVKTIYGEILVKISERAGTIYNIAPEYENCRRISLEKKVPLKEIYRAAVSSFGERGR